MLTTERLAIEEVCYRMVLTVDMLVKSVYNDCG